MRHREGAAVRNETGSCALSTGHTSSHTPLSTMEEGEFNDSSEPLLDVVIAH